MSSTTDNLKDPALGPRLIPTTNSPDLEPYYRVRENTTVGRHPSNRMVIPLDSVSRFHGKISSRGSNFYVQDLNSSNGTFVNGEKIKECVINHKDLVTFGEIEFSFRHEAGAPTASSGEYSDSTSFDIVELTDDSLAPHKPEAQKVIKSDDISSMKEKSSYLMKAVGDRRDEAAFLEVANRLTALYKLSEMFRSTDGHDVKDVIDRALDLFFSSVAADRGVILYKTSQHQTDMEIVSVRYRDQPITPQKVSISRTILDRVTSEKVSILSSDTSVDDRFDASESIIANQIRSAICVPMIQRGEVMGVIFLDTSTEDKSLTNADLEFVTMVGNELALALENERMRKEGAHRERLAAVGETVAGISHNAKNILLLMKGGSQLLDKAINSDNPKMAEDSWKVVKRGIDKISVLVQDMLEYSSNKKPALVSVDPNDMICAVAEEVEDRLIQNGVTLELDLEDDIPEYMLDKTGLTRTLENLIVNAMEAIEHENGRIVITTSVYNDADETLCIRVEDNGPGIPANVVEKIFIPFYTTKGSTGTGLGLPMCRKVVEDNGGQLEVESVEGTGTTFIMTLPRAEESDSTNNTAREGDEEIT